jgi:hypothetical protein
MAVDRVWDLITKLDGANATALSYKTIVAGHDAEHTMTEQKKESIRMKARYLAQAYQISLDSMPHKKWGDCCKEAIDRLAAVRIRYIKNSKVLERWHVEFRQRKTFHIKSKGKGNLPAFLQAHPIVVTVMKEYGHENLSKLLVEMMHAYLHDTIIKSLAMERLEGKEPSERTSEYEEEKLQLLKEYGLNCLSHTTTYRWMLLLGFRHETRRKGYYVDGHERKATIEYHWDFCARYLSLEKQMFRWIQVPLEEAEQLQTLGKVANGSGYKYIDELTGERMVEYHVDA